MNNLAVIEYNFGNLEKSIELFKMAYFLKSQKYRKKKSKKLLKNIFMENGQN